MKYILAGFYTGIGMSFYMLPRLPILSFLLYLVMWTSWILTLFIIVGFLNIGYYKIKFRILS